VLLLGACQYEESLSTGLRPMDIDFNAAFACACADRAFLDVLQHAMDGSLRLTELLNPPSLQALCCNDDCTILYRDPSHRPRGSTAVSSMASRCSSRH